MVVSPMWLEHCQEQGRRVPEGRYPSTVDGRYGFLGVGTDQPIAPKKNTKNQKKNSKNQIKPKTEPGTIRHDSFAKYSVPIPTITPEVEIQPAKPQFSRLVKKTGFPISGGWLLEPAA
jgi:hypothetical protein